MTRRLSIAALALALVFALGAAGVGSGAVAAPQNPVAQPAAPAPPPAMQDMMKMQATMMAEMKAADAKLDALLKNMSAASGDAKITAMAALIEELVRQQHAMHAHMGQMHQHMASGGCAAHRQ